MVSSRSANISLFTSMAMSSNCTNVMLRNHYIVPVTVSPIVQLLIGLYYALLILVESLLFSLLLAVHFKIRKCCHPFFGLLFGLMITCYIICGVIEAVCQFFFLLGAGEGSLSTLYLIYDLVYSAITPLCFSCLIERTMSTIWAVSYETNRRWVLFSSSVLVLVVGYVYFAYFQGYFLSGIVTAIIILGCILLYFLNKKWTIRYQSEKFMSKVTLSMRYQIIENLIVVRKALLPVIILDSLVTLVDILSSELTEQIIKENFLSCHSIMIYSPYIIFNHLAMLLEYSIPLYILVTRKTYNRQIPQLFHCLNFLKSSSRVHEKSRDSMMIQNVFGKDLNVIPTQNEYFEQLKNEWN